MAENPKDITLVEIAVEPKTKADQEKMSLGLARLAAEDPSFQVETDIESGQTIIKGMGELHLERLVDRLKNEFKVEVNIGQPQVAYREALGKVADIDYTHKKLVGGPGQFARVKIRFEPLELGSGFQFESKIEGGNIPKDYIPGVEKGLRVAKENGLLAGYPMTDIKATLYDGAYHDVDSSVLAFEIAARAAFRELKIHGDPRLMEPIMKVEIVTPEECKNVVIGDLSARRGQVQGTEPRGNATAINALVPLVNMFGYAGHLRGMSQGRAQFFMQLAHFAEVERSSDDDQPPPAMSAALSVRRA